MHRLKSFLERSPLFLFLLPVFFVLHGFIENFHYALAKESLLLCLTYIGVSLLFTCAFWLIIRNIYKAAIVAFFVMAFNFFFGGAHDFLNQYLAGTLIVKYTFIIPFTLIVIILSTIYLRKTSKPFSRIGLFLNSLLLVLIAIDTTTLLFKICRSKPVHVADLTNQYMPSDSYATPDIYLIIADEYAGQTTLNEIFAFNNSAFENDLKQRGFHIVSNTRSNYNGTVYSMASLFSMDYIHNLQQNIVNHKDMFSCRALIKKNNLLYLLKSHGYKTYNYSPFDFDNKKNFVVTPFFASKKEFFTAQTFTNRFWKNVGYHF